MDAELEFAIQPNTTGKQLFDQVGLCGLKREDSVCSIQAILFVTTFCGVLLTSLLEQTITHC